MTFYEQNSIRLERIPAFTLVWMLIHSYYTLDVTVLLHTLRDCGLFEITVAPRDVDESRPVTYIQTNRLRHIRAIRMQCDITQ